MSEKPLLLSSAKTGVPIGPSFTSRGADFLAGRNWWLRAAAFAVGLFMVGVGAIDLVARIEAPSFSSGTAYTAFAPGIVAFEPSVLSAVTDTSATSTTTPFVPARLVIPALSVDARIERVGVKPNGTMANPSSFSTVGWYQLGAKPGETGNAVLAGHVNNGLGLSGVFARLGSLSIGEHIVVRGEGKEIAYIVTEKIQYTTSSAPLEDIFTLQGPSQLVLITCEGDWDPVSRSYDKRLVVVARLAP